MVKDERMEKTIHRIFNKKTSRRGFIYEGTGSINEFLKLKFLKKK